VILNKVNFIIHYLDLFAILYILDYWSELKIWESIIWFTYYVWLRCF